MVKGHSQNSGHGFHGNDRKSNANPSWISLPKELWESLPASAKSTSSQHNHQYNVNTAQQDNAGCIPKALWVSCPTCQKCYIQFTMSY